MSQETEKRVVHCQRCGAVLDDPKPGQKAVICPGCGAAYVVHDPDAGWLQRNWELIQYRRSRRKAAARAEIESKKSDQITETADAEPVTEQVSEPVREKANKPDRGRIVKLTPGKKAGKRKWLLVLPAAAVILIALAVVVLRTPPTAKEDPQEVPQTERILPVGDSGQWKSLQLSFALPEPGLPIKKVIHDEENLMTVHFCPVDKAQFMDFLRRCEQAGFHWEPRYGDPVLRLYSEKGWALDLSHHEKDSMLDLSLKPTVTLGPMRWPSKTVPQPPAMNSYTQHNRDTYFKTYVGPMDHDQWSQYVDEIMAMGYLYDLSRRRDSFTGSLETGETLQIDFEGNDVVCIRWDAP